MNKTLIVADEIADDVQSGKIKQYIVKSPNVFIRCKYVFLKSASGRDLGYSKVYRIAKIEICHFGIFINQTPLTQYDTGLLAIQTGFENFDDMLEELNIPIGECLTGKLIIWTELRENTR